MAAAVVEESAAGEFEGAGAVRPHRGGGGGSERPNDHPEPRSNRPKQPVCGVAVGRTGGGSITAVGLGGRGRGGQYWLCWGAGGTGAGPDVAAGGGSGAAVGGPVLSVRGVV